MLPVKLGRSFLSCILSPAFLLVTLQAKRISTGQPQPFNPLFLTVNPDRRILCAASPPGSPLSCLNPRIPDGWLSNSCTSAFPPRMVEVPHLDAQNPPLLAQFLCLGVSPGRFNLPDPLRSGSHQERRDKLLLRRPEHNHWGVLESAKRGLQSVPG
jgi:hypothetical protein